MFSEKQSDSTPCFISWQRVWREFAFYALREARNSPFAI
jgi:hypothetical protein